MTTLLLPPRFSHWLVRSFGRRLLVLSMIICWGVVSATGARQSKATGPTPQDVEPSPTVFGQFDGVVTDVQGSMLTMEGGINIDASEASIWSLTEGSLNLAAIKPGMTVRVSVASGGSDTAPFVAQLVRIRVPSEIILTGRLQQVDVQTNDRGQITGGVIRILDRAMQVQFLQTVGVRKKQLRIGRGVTIVAVSNGDGLLITQILFGLEIPNFLP